MRTSNRRTTTTPPRVRRMPTYSTGPRILGLQRDPVREVGPGSPPPNFVSATTSASEWVLYWALAKVFNDPIDPRKPPFYGGRDWGFQIAINGGRRQAGGSVVDFVLYLVGEIVGIRLVSQRFHINAGPEKQAYDEAQARGLSRSMTVKDVYEGDIIRDRTGEGAVRVAIDTIGGRARLNPIRSGTARRIRGNEV